MKPVVQVRKEYDSGGRVARFMSFLKGRSLCIEKRQGLKHRTSQKKTGTSGRGIKRCKKGVHIDPSNLSSIG